MTFDTLVEVRASARNSYGWGSTSTTNVVGAHARTKPNQMTTPTTTSITEARIALEWTALSSPANGNSEVVSYSVYWDNGSGTTSIALLDSLVTSVSVPGLTGGVTYRFKVRARNIYGSGVFSTVLSVLASDLPDKMSTPTVTIGSADTSVTITWVEPGDHAASIDYYEILLLKSNGYYTT